MSSFSPEELERYARHLVLKEIGGPGQQKLKQSSVLIVGAGGLGAPVIQYLAAVGVGRLGIVDDDTVALSNLQRQIIHSTVDVGAAKVDSATRAVARINPNIIVEAHPFRVDLSNAEALIADYDVVTDGSDNFATRYCVSDGCFWAKKPLVTAAVGMFDGSLTTLKPYQTGPDGLPNPTYRCLFPEPPAPGVVPACAETGVLGALTGVMGTLMAIEAIRCLLGFGDGLIRKLLLFDAMHMRFETLEYGWDPQNPLSGVSRQR
jgi:adenylyltransferase/sulfurtransferase